MVHVARWIKAVYEQCDRPRTMIHGADNPGPGESQVAETGAPAGPRFRFREAYNELPKGMQVVVVTLIVIIAPLAFRHGESSG